MKKILLQFSMLIFLFSCKNEIPINKSIISNPSFINPPLTDVVVPSNSFIVQAEKGDTIMDEKGNVVIFP